MIELRPSLKKEFLDKRYLICDKIGEGGCSHVYKAQHLKRGDFVAIKIPKSSSYCETIKLEIFAYFKQSTKPYRLLNHPAIVHCYEIGELKHGIPYAIFEYISGDTLKQFLILKTKIEPTLIASIMMKVLNALVYSHEIGIVHGDLKPHNIMIYGSREELQVKLIDFGVNKSSDTFKSFNLECLSPQYSSPEQIKGNLPTPQSDLYSWALIFLECLIGVPVISGNSIDELIQNHLKDSEHIIPKEIREHPLGDLLALYLYKEVSRRGRDSHNLLEEFSKLDFSTLSSCLFDRQKNIQLNIDNTILSIPK